MSTKRNIEELDLDRLQEVLDYDPETGHLIWRVRIGSMCKIGQRAGAVQKKSGYRRISIDKRSYTASHLAWFHFYGRLPENDVLDFKNRDRDDTRIENLREATFSENARNIGCRANNSTGFKGVAKFNSDRNLKHYRSTVTIDGERIHLGQFSTPEEAYEAYCKKVAELHGEFGRVK